VFRPFPDNEISEVVVRRLASGSTIGIQVKTVQLADPHAYGNVLVSRASFVAAPSTYLVALGWVLPDSRFHPSCLIIPTEVLPSLAGTSGPYFELHFRPDGSAEVSRLDPYRVPLDSLAESISRRLSLLPSGEGWGEGRKPRGA
jgi:hypothetical protein